MPPRSSSSAAARSARRTSSATARESRTTRARPRPAPRRVPLRNPIVRLRWERLGRIALLVVLAAVVGLYVEHTTSYLSARAQNAHQQAVVDRYTRQNRALEAQKKSLGEPATIVRLARGLGMIRSGEQPFDITGDQR